MAEYKTTDTELTSIANAIRTKGGTSSSLVYPTGFVSAIGAIPSGGGGLVGWTDVTSSFTVEGDYDYFYAFYHSQSDTVVFFGRCGVDGDGTTVTSISTDTYAPNEDLYDQFDYGMPGGSINAVNIYNPSNDPIQDFFIYEMDHWDLTYIGTPLADTPDICFYCMYIIRG